MRSECKIQTNGLQPRVCFFAHLFFSLLSFAVFVFYFFLRSQRNGKPGRVLRGNLQDADEN
jgi:hypothetical protein